MLENRTSESGSDGVVLCRLAHLIWTAFGDAKRAETYFQRALNLCENDWYAIPTKLINLRTHKILHYKVVINIMY